MPTSVHPADDDRRESAHGGLGRLEYLSVREVAELWHVCERTVYREIERGALRAVRVGRALRVPVAVLEEYVGEVC